jgi:hypothetical protein
MSSNDQAALEQAISTLAALAKSFAGQDQFVSSTLGTASHALATHLAAAKWNQWCADKEAASKRCRFAARHQRCSRR